MNRHFLITYRATSENGGDVIANTIFVTKNNKFFSKITVENYIHEKEGFTNVVYTNIIELTESDYNDYLDDQKS